MTQLELHDEITKLRKDRSNHLMDESDYTDAIIGIVRREQFKSQIAALRWLQGKIKGQMFKAFVQVHIESLGRIGYAIKQNGTQL